MNTIPIGVLFGILAILILMSGFFSGSETALMSLNRYRLRHLAKNGHKGAQRTAKLLEHPERLIGLILLGNNFVNSLASAIATVIALRLLGEPGIAVATGVLTLVILIFAEVTPKTLATVKTEQIAFFASAIYTPMLVVFYPVVISINWLTQRLLDIFKVEAGQRADERLNTEEIRTVVDEAGDLIPDRDRDMLINILDLGNITVNDVMVPRNEILAIDLDDDWDDIVKQITESPHGRLLVFREDIDNVKGFVYLRKMLDGLSRGSFTREYFESFIREAWFIPEETKLTGALLNFQKEKRRIALVVDEYGDILGLLTIEDILEEIVGEFDADPYLAPDEIQPQEDGSYVVDGATPIRNLNRTLDWDLPATGPKTLNGLVLEHFESFPEKGIVFSFNEHPIEILEVEDNRVVRVRIDPAPDADDTGEHRQISASNGSH